MFCCDFCSMYRRGVVVVSKSSLIMGESSFGGSYRPISAEESYKKTLTKNFKLRGNDVNFSDLIWNKLDSELDSFGNKFMNFLGNIDLEIDIRKTHVKVRGIPQYECRINMLSDRGLYYAVDQGIGAIHAVSECLFNLEKQIYRKKTNFILKRNNKDKRSYDANLNEFEEN